MDFDTDLLRVLASRFRAAMERTDFSDTQWLRCFPKESCDITCKLFAIFLYDHGYRDFVIMRGTRPDGDIGKHQWLQFARTVVDITADQFEGENRTPVIVALDSPWHAALAGQPFKQFDDSYYELLTGDEYGDFTRQIYSRILSTLRGHG